MAAYHQCVVSVSAIRRYSSSSTRPLHSASSLAGATYTLPDRMGEAARNLTVQRTGGAGADRPTSHRAAPARWLTPGVVHVVGAWAVSRAIAIGAVTLGGSPNIDDLTYAWLNGWDGAWYKTIARDGYSDLPNEFGQTTWPFFPLLPLLWRGPVRPWHPVAGGLGRDLRRRLPRRAGRVVGAGDARGSAGGSPWARCGPCACSPRRSPSPWATPRRCSWPVRCGRSCSWATVATWPPACAPPSPSSPGPNGFTVAIALVGRGAGPARATTSRDRATADRLPRRSIASVAGPAVGAPGRRWCALLWRWAGDPLAFLSAKAGWDEITIIEFLSEPSWTGPARAAWPHVVMAVSAIVAVALGWRWLRAEWRALALLSLLPPLFTGIIGWGRYAADCFPVFLVERAPAGPIATVGDHPRADGRRRTGWPGSVTWWPATDSPRDAGGRGTVIGVRGSRPLPSPLPWRPDHISSSAAFAGRRCLVTGGLGFIGSNLARGAGRGGRPRRRRRRARAPTRRRSAATSTASTPSTSMVADLGDRDRVGPRWSRRRRRVQRRRPGEPPRRR